MMVAWRCAAATHSAIATANTLMAVSFYSIIVSIIRKFHTSFANNALIAVLNT
jgi:hypothetical protein